MKPLFKILETVKGTGNGYLYCVTDPIHPNAEVRKDRKKRYIYLHRVVMENSLGRLIKPEEQVDHKDGNKANNAPSNLILRELGPHQKSHAERGNHFWKKSPRNKPGRKAMNVISRYREASGWFIEEYEPVKKLTIPKKKKKEAAQRVMYKFLANDPTPESVIKKLKELRKKDRATDWFYEATKDKSNPAIDFYKKLFKESMTVDEFDRMKDTTFNALRVDLFQYLKENPKHLKWIDRNLEIHKNLPSRRTAQRIVAKYSEEKEAKTLYQLFVADRDNPAYKKMPKLFPDYNSNQADDATDFLMKAFQKEHSKLSKSVLKRVRDKILAGIT